jgi:hypothetical protein
MRKTTAVWALVLVAGVGLAARGQQQPTPVAGVTDRLGLDEKRPSELLGDVYESQGAGIAFRPPAGAEKMKQTDPNSVVEFMVANRQWLLKVTKASTAQPMPLQTVKDGAREKLGLLDYTVNEIKTEHPQAEVLRQEILNVGEYGVGVAALRFSLGNQRFLRQQAILQSTERLYYVFNFTTPAARDGKAEDNPDERAAVETFKAMVDSIQVLDQSSIVKDQKARLYRTRALFVDWNDRGGKRLKDAIVPEQWLRLVRDGKDVGYSYVVEEAVTAANVKANPARAYDGILISVRSRTIEGGTQVDIGSQLFTSLDRKHEDWAHVVNFVSNKGQKNEDKQQNSEYGFSELKLTRKVDAEAVRDPKDKKAPPLREVESYRLSVTRPKRDKDTMSKPEFYTPSPWYIPQALGSMLPRVLPLNKPVTYLFQSYVSDQKEVVHRYVDVGFEKEVEFAGKKVRVIPVTDRIRLEGTPTVHYMSPEGKYVGSWSAEGKIAIIPSSEAELKGIWKNADLTKQGEIAAPAGAK